MFKKSEDYHDDLHGNCYIVGNADDLIGKFFFRFLYLILTLQYSLWSQPIMQVNNSRHQRYKEENEVGISQPRHPSISVVTLLSNDLLNGASTIDGKIFMLAFTDLGVSYFLQLRKFVISDHIR